MWLGIDIGTGGSRALLVDARGGVRAGYTAAHEEMRMERPLWAEQRPENWWDAAVEAVRGALAKAGVSGREVRGIGLSGQMHGLVILDDAGAVIRPSLIWCDQRSQAQVDAVNAALGRENVVRFTANPVLTGFTLPKLIVGARQRAAEFRARAQDAAAQGLRALPPHRRIRHGGFRRLRHRGVRRGESPLVVRNDGRPGPGPLHSARVLRIERGQRAHHSAGRRADRSRGRDAGGGRRRRPGFQRRGQRHRGSRHRIVYAGHFRRGVRPHGQGGLRPRRPRTHILPRRARQVARDGRDPGRRPEPAVVPQSARAGDAVRRPHRGGGPIPRGRARPLLAALPDGRAHAPSGRHRARRLDRPDRQKHARRSHPRGDRRGLLQPARLPGHRGKPGRAR